MPAEAQRPKSEFLAWAGIDASRLDSLPATKAYASPSLPAVALSETAPSLAAEPSDLHVIQRVREGEVDAFGILVRRYQSKLFSTARRHARREEEVQDIVQEVFTKAYQRLPSFRAEAPFEHWLMRLTIHTCYDFLRQHQRNREFHVTDLGDEEREWLESAAQAPESLSDHSLAAKSLVEKILEHLSPAHRLIITLLEIEDRSIKEVSQLTGWSTPLVKVRAFRARAEMRKILRRIAPEKYL